MPFYTGFYALVVIILVGMYEREKNAWNNVMGFSSSTFGHGALTYKY